MSYNQGKFARGILCVFTLYYFIYGVACKRTPARKELSYLHFNLEAETRKFPRIKNARYFYWYKGWMRKSFIPRAVDSNAVLRFFTQAPRNRRLVISINNPNFTKWQRKLPVSFYANNFFLDTYEIEENCEITLQVPKEQITKGQNIIHFKVGKDYYDYYRKNLDTKDPTELFSIEDIYFKESQRSNERILRKTEGTQLLQPSGSAFKITINPKESRSVHYRFTPSLSGNTQGTLTVRALGKDGRDTADNFLKEILIHSEDEKAGQIDFQFTEESTILEFEYHSPDKASYIQWDQIATVEEPLPGSTYGGPVFKNKPHIFLIVIDAARYDLINREIGGRLIAPNIHKFSQLAYCFQNFYANAPNTRISVASMLSGLLPETHSVINPFNRLPERVKTLPSYLIAKDYTTTALVGNLVLLVHDLVRDFDSIYSVRRTKEGKFLNTSFMQSPKTIKILRNLNYKKPNFVYIHFLPPHKPYNPPQPFCTSFVNSTSYDTKSFNEKEITMESFHLHDESFIQFLYRCYLNNLLYADYLVGNVLMEIKNMGVFDESIVIVTSDHGEAFYEHQHIGHNTTNYQEMIHIPFLIKLPHQVEMKTVEGYYSLIDLLPTLAAMLNIKKDKYWQGKPITFQDQERILTPRALYSSTFEDIFNLSIIYGNHKYIFHSGRDELYDLEKDPDETRNIAGEKNFTTLYLKQKLLQQLGENFWLREELHIEPVKKELKRVKLIKELKALGYIK